MGSLDRWSQQSNHAIDRRLAHAQRHGLEELAVVRTVHGLIQHRPFVQVEAGEISGSVMRGLEFHEQSAAATLVGVGRGEVHVTVDSSVAITGGDLRESSEESHCRRHIKK